MGRKKDMIFDSLNKELIAALKEKDADRASIIRMLLSAIHNREIELHGKESELSEQDIFDVLKKELKKRNEAALVYEQGKRPELARKEKNEAAYIETLLPPQMSEEDIRKVVDEVFVEFGTVTQQDFGKVMKAVLAKTQGQADGSVVSGIIKKKIS